MTEIGLFEATWTLRAKAMAKAWRRLDGLPKKSIS